MIGTRPSITSIPKLDLKRIEESKMGNDTTATEFTCFETDDVGKATAVLAYPDPDNTRVAIVDVRADPPRSAGARPWCTVVIGCDDRDILEEAVDKYESTSEGPAIPCKRYESCRRRVMGAINTESEKYEGSG